jgi:hypothetical protein
MSEKSGSAADQREQAGRFTSGEDPSFADERGPQPDPLREEIRKVLQSYDADEIDELGAVDKIRDLVG